MESNETGSNETWIVQDERAVISIGSMSAAFDLSSPSSGLTFLWQDSVVAKRLFSVLVNDEPVESVVRLNDLIIRLPHRNSDLVSYEFCFRADPQGRGIDLLLSAQTNLLDSQPETKIVTDVLPGEVLAHSTSLQSIADLSPKKTQAFSDDRAVDYFLHRPDAMKDHSIVLMNHPSDFHEASVAVNDEDSATSTFSVFPVSLEKGVIRRARFRLRVVDRKQDASESQDHFAEFAAEAPPLAT